MTRTSRLTTLAAALVLAGPIVAQNLLRVGVDGGAHIVTSDLAILGSDAPRDDLPCAVEPLDPQLQYDLNFQAGYNAAIPLASLAGSGNSLRVLFRITPLDTDDGPTYFRERFNVPPIVEDAVGDANLPGKYRLGPGRYRVDWLMRDRAERVCSATWEIAAETLDGFEKLAASPTSSMIREAADRPFREEAPVRRSADQRMHVKLLVNFTPGNTRSASLNPFDLDNVVSMMRAISREPSFHQFTVAAYHLHEERVFYEQQAAPRIDFEALGEAMQDVQGGVVDISSLEDKESNERFLQALLDKHLKRPDPAASGRASSADLIVFLGPKLIFERNPTRPLLDPREIVDAPLYYLIYNRNPRSYPWKDAVSTSLKTSSLREFDILSPKDFGRALWRVIGGIDVDEPIALR